MSTTEFIGNMAALVIVLATLVGVPTFIVEWMRQHRSAKEHLAQLEAWREAQLRREQAEDRRQEEQARSYVQSVQLQEATTEQTKANHADYVRFSDRAHVTQDAHLRVAEAQLEERRRTNALLRELLDLLRTKGPKDEPKM